VKESSTTTPSPSEQTRKPTFTVIATVSCIVIAIGIGVGVAVMRSKNSNAATAASSGSHAIIRDVPRLEGNVIVFTPAFRQRANLGFTKVERSSFKATVRVVGTVALNPSHVAAVGTRLRGTVRRTFKFEGDSVAAGDSLAEIESAELGEAQAGIAQAEATFQAAEIHARREKDLLERSLTTARESEVAQTELATNRASLQAAQQRVRALGGGGTAGNFGVHVLRAPLAGHVIERHLSPGQSVDVAGVGYKIADLAHLWVELSIFERDLGSVHVGDDVEIVPVGGANQENAVKIPGKVAHVGELIDPRTRSTDVRIAVDHPKVHLRPGQSVEATIVGETRPRDALLIPHSSVVYVDGKVTVFVAENGDETRVRATNIRLGASDGTQHEVLEGLTPGQLVASGGVFALKSELFR